jgi:hypothetical protein
MPFAPCRNLCRRRTHLRRSARVTVRPAKAGRLELRFAHALRAVALTGGALTLGGCGWLGLGWGALTYPTTRSGEVANVVAHGEFAYATRGAAGIEVIEPASGHRHAIALPASLGSADDLAAADGLLFVLDAREPGQLAVFTLDDPHMPRLVGAPVPVDVGPFSGVSAASGRVVVSGGTKSLTVRAYDSHGALGEPLVHTDLGRGQPDVLLSVDGLRAFVSTHDRGPDFSLVMLELAARSAIARGALPLVTYGFTPGGAKPASFPIESALQDDALYVAHAAGLLVADVSHPDAPRELALLDVGFQPVNVDVRDGLAAVVGSRPRPSLAFVDVRSAGAPRVIDSVALPQRSRPTGVVLLESHAVVAAHAAGALLIPVPASNPSAQ